MPPPKIQSTTTPLPDSDWTRRREPIPFRQMIAVTPDPSNKPTSTTSTFISLSASYPPSPTPRSYGGNVFAQAGWAAAHTVPYGMHIHSMTGYFLEIGDVRYAFRHVVRKVRTGGIYAIRYVEVYKDAGVAAEGKGSVLCFVGTVGFKRDESKKHAEPKPQRQSFAHQTLSKGWLEKEYASVLSRKRRFEDWPVCQGMDGLWTEHLSVAAWKQRGDAFPGLEMKKVDMSGFNADPETMSVGGECGGDDGKAARDWRLLLLYRLIDSDDQLPSTPETGASDAINLHACAHLYASDRNSLFLAQRALGFHDSRGGQMGTLSHTVNFHGAAKDWVMTDDDGTPKEYVQESWVSDSGADRVLHNSRLWERGTGRIVATTVQDGMMRIPVEGMGGGVDGDAIMRREAKL